MCFDTPFLIFTFSFIILKSFLINNISSAPHMEEINFELTGDYFEGDMILSKRQSQALNGVKRKARNVITSADFRWPKGIVDYHISQDFDRKDIKLLHQAMDHISQSTCIRFREVSLMSTLLMRPYVLIRPSPNSCSATVGYQGKIMQHINLMPSNSKSIGCFRLGTLVHELLHTLGLYHQHSAADRDGYVRIHKENIRPGKEHNFRKLPIGFTSNYGVSYDYLSVMHYSSYAFTSNGRATIEPLAVASELIGQRKGLSKKDIIKLKRMYECNFMPTRK